MCSIELNVVNIDSHRSHHSLVVFHLYRHRFGIVISAHWISKSSLISPNQTTHNEKQTKTVLVDMSNPTDAVDLIIQFFSNRRNKSWTKHHESLMNLFMDIGLNLREPQMIKDGLSLYRNITQQSNPKSLANVIDRLLQRINDKIAESKVKAKKSNVSCERLLLNQVQFKTGEECAEDHFMLPWIRYAWECQRNVLDVLQGHNAFQPIYHKVLKDTHAFLSKFERTREFRMLCNNVSKHYQNVVRTSRNGSFKFETLAKIQSDQDHERVHDDDAQQ